MIAWLTRALTGTVISRFPWRDAAARAGIVFTASGTFYGVRIWSGVS